MALDFMIEQVLEAREPIEHINVPFPIGQVWVVASEPGKYQTQLRDSDRLPKELVSGSDVILISNGQKTVVKAIASSLPGCFDFENDDNKLGRKLYDASVIASKPLYLFRHWDASAVLQHDLAERNLSAMAERIQPINAVVKALMTIDAAVARWESWDKDPQLMPETDLEGKPLSDFDIGQRLSFYHECQAQLNDIANKSLELELSEPVDYKEFIGVRRTSEIAMISAALGIPIRSPLLAGMSSEVATSHWSEIVRILKKHDPDSLDNSTDNTVAEVSEFAAVEVVGKKPDPGKEKTSRSKKSA